MITTTGPILEPQPGSGWAGTMVLNPGIVRDEASGRIHMLFRASGPGHEPARLGRPAPYPIYLGYGWSDDEGGSWQADYSCPALAPRLEEVISELEVMCEDGRRRVNYANGCIEDPRLVIFEGACYVTVACRLFPPGPYWERDEPMQCAPDWAKGWDHPYGRAGRENLTVSVLYRVDLEQLGLGKYDRAFTYVTHLTDPERGDNRNVFLFPRRLTIDGRPRVVCVQRPAEAGRGSGAHSARWRPRSITLCAADTFEEMPGPNAHIELLAEPRFDWELDRVGGSWPPIEVEPGEWLLAYHGKQDARMGYTQSFMILQEQGWGFPTIMHRCSERMLYARERWELEGKFGTPCLFTCGGIVCGERLLMSYGAADTRVGIASARLRDLVERVRQYDARGVRLSMAAMGQEKSTPLA